MASSTASSSHSIDKDMKSHQSDIVIIYIQSGGSLQTINGITEYTPLGLPKRILSLPSPVNHSALVMHVKKKLNLSGNLRLFYKNPGGEIFEICDDEDMLMFENLLQITSQTLTLFVDDDGGGDDDDGGGDDDDGGGGYRSSDSNRPDIARYIPLDRAIMRGNWEKAKEILENDQGALTAELDVNGDSPLHIAIEAHKLEFVNNLLKMIKPELLRKIVNKNKWTALHSAAFAGNLEAAKELVKKDPYLLFIVDSDGYLPIHIAIINFNMKTFDYLLEESKTYIVLCRDRSEVGTQAQGMDLVRERMYEDLVRERVDEPHPLTDTYTSPFDSVAGVHLLTNVIFAGKLDVADQLIQEYPNLANTKHDDISPLNALASKSDAYRSGTTYNFYQRFLYSHIPEKNSGIHQERYMTQCLWCYFYRAIQGIYAKFWELAQHVPHIKKISQEREKHNAAFRLLECICEKVAESTEQYDQISRHYCDGFNLAVKNDTDEAIEVIIRYFPQATWIRTSSDGYNLSQNAIKNRSEKVYNFLVNKVVNNHLLKTCIHENGNNILHLAGEMAPIHKLNVVSGAALQMQKELQWFKEVERFVYPSDKEQKNKNKDTPMMVFRTSHEGLRKDGEEWMKKTADSFTITAALIITIAFAAAITVPGGNNGETGKAIFERQASFILFVVSDAISLFTSSTSLLLFLSVLTARYREEDFLYSLPTNLILGLVMLFLSMTSMIVAFSATLYLLFGQENSWILIPIGVLTCLPIASFIRLQFPLLVDMIVSTYGRGIFPKKRNYELRHQRA